MDNMENDKQSIFDELNDDIHEVKYLLTKTKESLICNSSEIKKCNIVRKQEELVLQEHQKFNMEHPENLIEMILREKYGIENQLKLRKENIKGFDNSAKFVDEKQELKDVATNFVYRHLLTSDAIILLLNDVQNLWDLCLEKYVEEFNSENSIQIEKDDIKLLYRGGNTLTSILDELLKKAPPLLFKQIKETFKDVMAKSDIDFTIMINPLKYVDGDVYEQLFNDINIIILGIMFRVRLRLLTIGKRIFKTITSSTLKKLLENLNSMECVQDIPTNISPYKGFKFVRVVYNDVYYESQNLDDIPANHDINKYNLGVFSDNISGSGHDNIQNITYNGYTIIQRLIYFLCFDECPEQTLSSLYVTYNKDIRHKSEKFLQRYSLARLKINFRAYYIYEEKLNVINLPGELIDLSLTNNNVRDDNEIVHTNTQTDLINKWNNLLLYKFAEKTNVATKDIYSFSLDYYFVDICNMLFLVVKDPWENKKYAKLLKRLILLCMINLLAYTQENGIINTQTGNTHIISFMKNISNDTSIETKIEYIKSINNKLYFLMLFEKINNVNKSITEHNIELTKFNDTIKTLLQINNGIITSSFSLPESSKPVIDFSQTRIVL
jgi:hypothetical protein